MKGALAIVSIVCVSGSLLALGLLLGSGTLPLVLFRLGFITLSSSGSSLATEMASAVDVPPMPTKVPGSLGVEGVLGQQLERIDVVAEPMAAGTVHAALGNVLQNTGGRQGDMLKHFEAARDAAILAGDGDKLVAAQVELGGAYLRENRALDAFRVLSSAEIEARYTLKNTVQRVALHQALGRTRHALGWTDSALRHFEEALQNAELPEELVSVLTDIGLSHVCLGHANQALEALESAARELRGIPKDPQAQGGMSEALRVELASELHRRLAATLHIMGRMGEAKAHYATALRFEEAVPKARPDQLDLIKDGLGRVQQSRSPDLSSMPCPTPREPRTKPAAQAQDPLENTAGLPWGPRVKLLMAKRRYEDAEATVRAELRRGGRETSGDDVEAASLLNSLGRALRSQQRFEEAGSSFMEALRAALKAAGDGKEAGHQEADAAYKGLSYIQVMLHAGGFEDAAVAIYEDAVVAGDMAVIPRTTKVRAKGELRLKANAWPTERMPAEFV